MRILVTGSNGYIGTGIVRKLVSMGACVIATDIGKNNLNEGCKYISANLFEIEQPFEYFDKPDILIHLAWRDGFKHNSNAHIDDLPKHYHFIEKIINSKIKKIVVMGSMHEVGFFEGSIDASTACNPMSLYGISKNSLRQSLEILCKNSNVNLLWLRGYYIVGNSERGNSIFSKITQAEKNGEKEFPFTSGKNQYDFIDYRDFCNMIITFALDEDKNGIINCCSGFPEKLSERVERFIKENNYKIKLKYGAFPDRIYDSLAVWGKVSE